MSVPARPPSSGGCKPRSGNVHFIPFAISTTRELRSAEPAGLLPVIVEKVDLSIPRNPFRGLGRPKVPIMIIEVQPILRVAPNHLPNEPPVVIEGFFV